MAINKPIVKTTKIADRDVQIEAGELIAIRFSGGRLGESEAGVYEFWTVCKVENGTVKKWTARCHQGSDPGERFRRMEGERGYEDCWQIASTAKAIRPARQHEVTHWLNGHREDTAFAELCHAYDKTMKLVETVDGFRFEKIQ